MLLVKCWWQSPLAIFFFNTCSPIIRLIPHSNPTNTHEVIRQNLLFLASYLLSCCFRCFKSLCYLLMFLSWGDNNLLHIFLYSSWNESPSFCDSLCPQFSSVQFTSVAQLCPIFCDPMNRSTPGLPVHQQLPEFTQTQIHRVSDAIQPSHPLSSPSPPAPNPSQHQSLFKWVNSSHEVAKVLEFQL